MQITLKARYAPEEKEVAVTDGSCRIVPGADRLRMVSVAGLSIPATIFCRWAMAVLWQPRLHARLSWLRATKNLCARPSESLRRLLDQFQGKRSQRTGYVHGMAMVQLAAALLRL